MEKITHRITLDFEDAETLALALEYISEKDAPVMITSGSVATGGVTRPLWEGSPSSESAAAVEDHGAVEPMTASDLIRAVRQVAAELPGRVCEGLCEYRDEVGNPVCLIGHALARFGWHNQMTGNAENIAAVLFYDWPDRVKSTRTQRDWLHHVQMMQDNRTPWREAVLAADQKIGPIG